MPPKFIYITDSEWFENGPLHNPICLADHHIKQIYPEFYALNYDLRILATKAPEKQEKEFAFYNDYRDKYGSSDISIIDSAAASTGVKNIFLNGFNQEQFEYIVPMIKETAEVLYLFKCTKICDLSALSEFKKLKGLFIFANTTLTSLWDMRHNENLKILSFAYITKLQNIEYLIESNVEYVNFDSSDNSGNEGEMLFDETIFKKMPGLKHLFLTYKAKQ